jgi:hypothetical protein
MLNHRQQRLLSRFRSSRAGDKQRKRAKPRLNIERLEDRQLLSGVTAEALVGQMYLDLLQRSADPAGLAGWSGLLNQGAPATQVATGIVSSAEYRTKEIQNLYVHRLGRNAEPEGLNNWLLFLENHGTGEMLEEQICASLEYFNRSGGTNAAFLSALYHDVLGRAVDPTGASGWGGYLAQHPLGRLFAPALWTLLSAMGASPARHSSMATRC